MARQAIAGLRHGAGLPRAQTLNRLRAHAELY
jgi:hypothetical protein